jgi:hypothetical protein
MSADAICSSETHGTKCMICVVATGVTVSDSPESNLARQIVSILPPFSPSSSRRVTNEQCLRESQHYLQELDNFALWALRSEYLINISK